MEFVGINEKTIEEISKIKDEDEKVLAFRLDSYQKFMNLPYPSYGPKNDIDFSKIVYYKEQERTIKHDWNQVNDSVKCELENLGVLESEKHLDGIGVQYESEVIYHNMLSYLKKKNIIFTSIEDAIKNHRDLIDKYFGKLVKSTDNKYAALNGAVFSGGSFIYIPPFTKLDRPLQSYFRINSRSMGQFERTLIILFHH